MPALTDLDLDLGLLSFEDDGQAACQRLVETVRELLPRSARIDSHV